MKRILSLLLILCLVFPVFSFAELDEEDFSVEDVEEILLDDEEETEGEDSDPDADADFDFSDLLEKTYYEKSYEQVLTISGIVAKAERFFGEKVVYGYVDYEDYVKNKLNPADFDGAINDLRIIRGCECAIFTYPMNEATVKVSLRSIGTVDVSKISEIFGGGGHKRAAGFYLKGSREEVLHKILDAIEEQTGWTR